MTTNAITDAKHIVRSHFPDCSVALLGGSVARGDQTETSDLDLIILYEDGSDYRKSFYANGWPVEVFVHSINTYSVYFELDRQCGMPLYTRMYSESIILRDDGNARLIKKRAGEILEEGPRVWSKNEITDTRYIITDILNDLKGSKDTHEDYFIVSTLLQVLQEFILRTNQKWIGEGKWILRSLREYNPQLADELCECMRIFYQNNDKKQLISFSETILKNNGGELFDGYSGKSLL
jgi:predicted nucleotidyltransferase